MNIAIIGCGYVADFYLRSLRYHPELSLRGAYDINQSRLEEFCDYFSVRPYRSADELLGDDSVELILNLTNPRSHYDVTRACIEAGKHVYSEKPLAMNYESAEELVGLARSRGVYLGAAPCSVLGETAQTVWKALSDGVIGPVRLVYANFDAGMTSRLQYRSWRSESGALWPAKDEFEVGCTYEHAGYFLTWLAAFFGPAKAVTAFASCQVPDKGIPLDVITPDYTVGNIEYEGNVVARVTCSIIAPLDRSLMLMGERGIIYVKDIRDDASPVYVKSIPPHRLEAALEYRLDHWSSRIERWLNWLPWSWGNYSRIKRNYPFAQKPALRWSARYKPVDFCRGPAEMAAAIRNHRPSVFSAEFALHITELIGALQYPGKSGGRQIIRSVFAPISPS
ncbi:MAG: gfo/Idh/MocA family oxidoreductase [Proteobacteria bacterium]|nr:MAG: gfo/Idh/MocA family oxidoreductase [Pseudomonadota bacterium]